jgi:hemin uptake protein HemP
MPMRQPSLADSSANSGPHRLQEAAIAFTQGTAHSDGSASASCVDSSAILQGRKTVEISHNGSTYRLQATRLGKLILTK